MWPRDAQGFMQGLEGYRLDVKPLRQGRDSKKLWFSVLG